MLTLDPDHHLWLHEVVAATAAQEPVQLSGNALERIQEGYDYLHARLAAFPDEPIYGINTGFGALANVPIAAADRAALQRNLLMSHACGMGAEVPADIVRLMLILKAQSLCYGHSGVPVATVQRLVQLYNRGVLPIVYQQGSLGASGDLAPLAHLCLPLIGLGRVRYEGVELAAADALHLFGWAPLELQAKEGLALLNGTQFMSAYGAALLTRARRLAHVADVLAALSLEGFDGRAEPFLAPLHRIRPHDGQVAVAGHIRELLAGSDAIDQPKKHVQDPYSFRCVPQVHGATRDALTYVEGVFATELNAVTDNPNIFPEEDLIVSGGNFHGQPLALALDFAAIALAELGSISERRVFQLISGHRGLPPFLVQDPGLNSGLMIPQYTAAGIVSQSKQLCTPASVDSIVSSNGQEDHVSMGANAATKAWQVGENVARVLGIELLTAAQAVELRQQAGGAPIAPRLQEIVTAFRATVPFLAEDRVLYPDMEAATRFVLTHKLLTVPA
ncbi:MAG: histidine ammonia-lyase [Hymenobacteraceae bacterium]|nr:histidine ammonia-lyase [Hymenobacteraceae bacterium]